MYSAQNLQSQDKPHDIDWPARAHWSAVALLARSLETNDIPRDASAALLKPQAIGGASRDGLRAFYAHSHGNPTTAGQTAREWADAVNWKPGFYTRINRDRPLMTGNAALSIEETR
ncbi:hypothetical protein [Bosea lathyri]|uniref:Uncharacterized protein n=1 Tax=Bosea lathyri TaxID=1036778 RepID=A0A1H6BV56_9HYPH|nr:hypothetical protein [Bosea lathyri]SEG64611.1 hypothetical protein SAMN04488115_108110 [Bosea lathyri]